MNDERQSDDNQDVSIDAPAIAFIGGGNMAQAMITGLESLDDHPEIRVCDLDPRTLALHQEGGRFASDDLDETLSGVPVVVVAVKPQHLASLMPNLRAAIEPGALVISVLAGTPCEAFESGLAARDVRVCRVMPNTPMAVGEGMCAVAPGRNAKRDDITLARDMCALSGEVLVVREDRMDAITAVSGSGPAYFFRFCEVFMEAARDELEFSDAEARLLVCQTAKGAMEYLAATDGFPAGQLRQQVTSKGGTTAAGLAELNKGNIDELARNALNAAVGRAKELAALTTAKAAGRAAEREVEPAEATSAAAN